MRLTFVCKRHPQQRDLVSRPYGRFHHLPAELAKLGHDVQVLLVSHRGLASESGASAGLRWSSDDIRSLGPLALLRRLQASAAGFSPDWIVGLSDATFGWLAGRMADRLGCRLAIDAYDDYEAYMPWNVPLHLAWRRAVRRAHLVTAAGPQLAALLAGYRRADSRPVEVVPMTADPGFIPMEKHSCRTTLGLPTNPLVGYVGGWGSPRGMSVLVEAWIRLHAARPDTRLVLSGRPPADVASMPGVLAIGYVPDDSLPMLLNALDVACVVGADSRFSRSSYPSKLCEAMACGVPVVATATEPVRWMLREDSRWLVPLADPAVMAARIEQRLASGRIAYPAQPRWPDLAQHLSHLLDG